jgi:hypothetical protein
LIYFLRAKARRVSQNEVLDCLAAPDTPRRTEPSMRMIEDMVLQIRRAGFVKADVK